MKKLLLLLVVFWGSLLMVNAKYVTPERAKKMAFVLMKDKDKNFEGRVWSVCSLERGFEKTIYLVNFYPSGWMLLSADDATFPLLAYDNTGHFLPDKIPENLLSFLGTYARQIKENIELKRPSLKQWNSEYYAESEHTSRTTSAPIKSLIKVKWDQGSPYNYYCPKSEGQTAVVGCVAIAMGQALSVYQYPARAVGQHTDTIPEGITYPPINYDEEAPYDWEKIMDGNPDGYREVARFLYHLGTAVDMTYGIKTSGAFPPPTFPLALINHFSFSKDLHYQSKDDYKGDWNQLIISELKKGRPIVYLGIDPVIKIGHAFNVDGYDGDGKFHVCFGWSGRGDGYYTLNNLQDDVTSFHYDVNQGAIIGLRVPEDRPTNVTLSNQNVTSGKKPGEVVGTIIIGNYQDAHTYEYYVRGKFDQVTQAYQTVPFAVKNGQLVTTELIDANIKKYEVEILVIDTTLNASIKQGFSIQVLGNPMK